MALRRRVFLLLSVSLLLLATVQGQTSSAPFELSWITGSCRNCEIVRQLGAVAFSDNQAIWAGAYYFPSGGDGSGDYSVVRSNDSGRHWVEIPKSRMHATEPSFSFVSSKNVWISAMNSDGESLVLRSDDGGLHWAPEAAHFIQNMQFLNARVGVGDEFDGRASLFAKTADGGRSWVVSKVPDVRFIDKVFFLTPEVGWIAGTNDLSDDLNGRVAFVLRTTDGGQHWASFRIPSPIGVADIRDLFFLNESMGWMITWHYNNEGTHLYRTSDGGRTWTIHPDETMQGPGTWLSVVRFLNPKIGFAFSRRDEVETGDALGVDVVANPEAGPTNSGRLLYSDDGGEHWRSYALDAWIYDCQILGQDLGCSAAKSTSAFMLLRVTPKAAVHAGCCIYQLPRLN